MTLPITKKQFIESIVPFINKYQRLPFFQEDDILVQVENDEGEIESRPYKASRYIDEFFNTQDKLIKYLLDKKMLTYDFVSEVTGLSPTIVENLMTTKTKNPNAGDRRRLHMFFNKDFYQSELSSYDKMCDRCKEKDCKHDYWVTVISCPRYKRKK